MLKIVFDGKWRLCSKLPYLFVFALLPRWMENLSSVFMYYLRKIEAFMSVEWNFPSNSYGTVNGISDAGIETFTGSVYKSLAREILQNSMDARFDQGKPVEVEFVAYNLLRSYIPHYEQLYSALKSCEIFWKKQNNKKIEKFFSYANSRQFIQNVSFLRISDFNTTGLTGSDRELNTPWQNLVKASGISDKSGTAGGSFGIGKSAPFACSDYRTIFYSTLDENNIEAFQGVARLVSFPDPKGGETLTTGTGYYGESEKNTPIRECKSLQLGYQRKSPGTDIYIASFKKEKNWEKEILTAVLEDFLVAIYNGDLVVRISEYNVSKNTLPVLIDLFKEACPTVYNFYQALTTPTHEFLFDFEGLGNVSLKVLLRPELHRRVMVCRKNGMRIFDQKKISGNIDFAGVCVLEGDCVNAYFREMENPQHNAWEWERHSRKSEAKIRINDLKAKIKNYILDVGSNVALDETDAEGVGEYLSDFDESESKNQERSEQISNSIHEIQLDVSPRVSSQKGFEKISGSGKNYEEDAADFVDYTGGDSGSKDDYDEEPNKTHDGPSFGKNDGPGNGQGGLNSEGDQRETGTKNDESDSVMKSAYEVNMMSVRLVSVDISKNEYRLIFVPEKISGEGLLHIKLSGEQPGKMPLKIISAIDENTGKMLKCIGDEIELPSVVAKEKYKLKFRIDYSEKCSMEVNLYGRSR